MEEVAFHFSLQYPINLWYECKTGFEFVMPKTYLFLFDIVAIGFQTFSQVELLNSLQRFCLLSGLPTVAVVPVPK